MSRARSKARRCALQALYQWQMAGQDLVEIETQFVAEHDMAKTDVVYFQALLREVPTRLDEIDGHITPHLDRALKSLDPVELAALRIGVCELAYHPDIPYRVVINEAVELTKTFGADQSHKYINGVLDKVARALRSTERKMNSR